MSLNCEFQNHKLNKDYSFKIKKYPHTLENENCGISNGQTIPKFANFGNFHNFPNWKNSENLLVLQFRKFLKF